MSQPATIPTNTMTPEIIAINSAFAVNHPSHIMLMALKKNMAAKKIIQVMDIDKPDNKKVCFAMLVGIVAGWLTIRSLVINAKRSF